MTHTPDAPGPDDRSILQTLRLLRKVKPSADRTSELLATLPPPRRRWPLAGLLTVTTLAASVALAVFLWPRDTLPTSAQAALIQATQATNAYRGWMRVDHVFKDSQGQQSQSSRFVNTDGSVIANRTRVDGQNSLSFCDLTGGVEYRYGGKLDLVLMYAIPDPLLKSLRDKATDPPIPNMEKILALPGTSVERHTDGKFVRIDVIRTEPPSMFVWYAKKLSLWIDPETKLVVNGASIGFKGETDEWTNHFNVSPVKDIYDLGVPRDTDVADRRKYVKNFPLSIPETLLSRTPPQGIPDPEEVAKMKRIADSIKAASTRPGTTRAYKPERGNPSR